MKKILVPTDFSPLAENAADVALSIAQKANAQIDFIHLFKTKNGGGSQNADINHWVEKAKTLGLKSDPILVQGSDNELIVEHGHQGDYDLIVMGSHQVPGVKSLFVQTNAQMVVRKSMVPVLVLKEETKELNINNIVYASNFEEEVDDAWLKVISIADLFEADIHLLYVNEPEFSKKTTYTEGKMEAFLDKCPRGTCSKNIYNAGYPEMGILHFAESKNMDLIALITHGQRGGLRKWDTSLTEWIVKRGNKPVLSVNINTGDAP
jgi:nucleotide-binding universal stress UspA family protein